MYLRLWISSERNPRSEYISYALARKYILGEIPADSPDGFCKIIRITQDNFVYPVAKKTKMKMRSLK